MTNYEGKSEKNIKERNHSNPPFALSVFRSLGGDTNLLFPPPQPNLTFSNTLLPPPSLLDPNNTTSPLENSREINSRPLSLTFLSEKALHANTRTFPQPPFSLTTKCRRGKAESRFSLSKREREEKVPSSPSFLLPPFPITNSQWEERRAPSPLLPTLDIGYRQTQSPMPPPLLPSSSFPLPCSSRGASGGAA